MKGKPFLRLAINEFHESSSRHFVKHWDTQLLKESIQSRLTCSIDIKRLRQQFSGHTHPGSSPEAPEVVGVISLKVEAIGNVLEIGSTGSMIGKMHSVQIQAFEF